MVLKKLKKWGAGLGIYFNKDEVENNELEQDNLIEIPDESFKNKKVKKKK